MANSACLLIGEMININSLITLIYVLGCTHYAHSLDLINANTHAEVNYNDHNLTTSRLKQLKMLEC